MKFKYDYLNNRLWWKIENNYSHEVCEENQFRPNYDINGFHLGEKEWITFTFSHLRLKVHYQKGANSYQKTLDLPSSGIMFFELTEKELI